MPKIANKHTTKTESTFSKGREQRGGGYRDYQAAPKDVPRASYVTASSSVFHPGDFLDYGMNSYMPWLLLLGGIGILFIVTRYRTL